MKASSNQQRAAQAAAQAAAQQAAVQQAAAQPPAAASGSIGAPTARKRRAPEEGTARALSDSELDRIVEEEIVDMDDLVQATEQSGMAVKAAPKLEHTLPQETGGPSVILDDSLMQAAAAYTATMGDAVRPAHTVSDTWMDFGPREVTPTVPPPSPIALAEAEAPQRWPTPPPAPGPVAGVPPPAPTPFSRGATPSAASEAPTPILPVIAATRGVPSEPSDEITPPDPTMAPVRMAEDDGFDLDIDVDVDVPMVIGEEADDADYVPQPMAAMSYTLTVVGQEHEDAPEYEGLLIEEKRALQKGPAARIIAVIGIVGGIAVLSLLGYLIWARLNPEKVKPPSWANLKLSDLNHDLIERKGQPSIIRVEVRVQNASKEAKYRHVHIKTLLLTRGGEIKCQNYAPCGLWLSRKEILGTSKKTYHQALRYKSAGTAYNVQLNPGQDERCQALLFCGSNYEVGKDRIKVVIDKERTERLKQ
ncbi:MAG: hypothetical protein ABI333_19840 [bacterium]